MIEFGSDFHYIQTGSNLDDTLFSIFPSANYYADGRQALIHLYRSQGWQRLWVPEYYCYDVIESLRESGLALMFYTDCPIYRDDTQTLKALLQKDQFRSTDAILRVNYFGMRSFRANGNLPVAAIVEDHTHDLIGDWAIRSDADWCIASLRKTLPIPEGGMLWSPVGLRLPEKPILSEENEKNAAIRWEAMQLKARYLAGEKLDKTAFRAAFIDTESYFDYALVCSLDIKSQEYLSTFNVRTWYMRKYENWKKLCGIKRHGTKVILPEGSGSHPFSLLLLFDLQSERDRVRKELIAHNIYPAVLWNIPCPTDGDIFKFSRGMLSIHCDGRYNDEDIEQMKLILESIL